jgi:hypothetical protein
VSGGTVLSILRWSPFPTSSSAVPSPTCASIVHLNETHVDMVRKDEFSTRMTSVWNSIKGMQESQATVTR